MLPSCDVAILESLFIHERGRDVLPPPGVSKYSSSSTDAKCDSAGPIVPGSALFTITASAWRGLTTAFFLVGLLFRGYEADWGRRWGSPPSVRQRFRGVDDGAGRGDAATGVSKAGGSLLPFAPDPSKRGLGEGRYWPKAKPRAAALQDAELAHSCSNISAYLFSAPTWTYSFFRSSLGLWGDFQRVRSSFSLFCHGAIEGQREGYMSSRSRDTRTDGTASIQPTTSYQPGPVRLTPARPPLALHEQAASELRTIMKSPPVSRSPSKIKQPGFPNLENKTQEKKSTQMTTRTARRPQWGGREANRSVV